MSTVTGIHHITCIAGDPQENVDFYTGTLGMRLVKKSVNQDVPDTYHLFYADGEAHPGADLTFFPWPKLPPVQKGVGLAVEVSLAIPAGSLEYWADRLAAAGANVGDREVRHGARTLRLTDPHGLELALVETTDEREFTAWAQSPVPAVHQIRGLHAARLWEHDLAPTASFLVETLGFALIGEENGWRRYGIDGGGSGKHVDLRAMPNESRGSWGTGGVHHVAWRVPDDAAELEVRERLARAKRRPTEVIDRFWFKSVYFLEPGGVLFEIATDGPGFTVDEDLDSLGEHLVLPPWLEPQREAIEDALPTIDVRV
jgi:glyoxalase family protein